MLTLIVPCSFIERMKSLQTMLNEAGDKYYSEVDTIEVALRVAAMREGE